MEVDGRAPDMRHQRQAVGIGQRGDLEALGEAAAQRQVGLHHVERALGQEVAERRHADQRLATGQCHAMRN